MPDTMSHNLGILLHEGYEVAFSIDREGCGYRANLSGPLGSSSAGLGDTPVEALASVWPQYGTTLADEGQAAELGPVDSTAAAVLAAKITTLREYVARALSDKHHDGQSVLGRVSGGLGRISAILATATEDVDDDDDREPYCSACGHWVGHFHGLEGWHHFRGDPAPGGQRELYDAGHETIPAWCVPPGRALAPADVNAIRAALVSIGVTRPLDEEEAG